MMKQFSLIAAAFDALGNPRRARLFQILVSAYPQALTVAQLSSRARLPQSSLAHHLRMLERGELIARRVRGPSTFVSLYLPKLRSMEGFLKEMQALADQPEALPAPT